MTNQTEKLVFIGVYFQVDPAYLSLQIQRHLSQFHDSVSEQKDFTSANEVFEARYSGLLKSSTAFGDCSTENVTSVSAAKQISCCNRKRAPINGYPTTRENAFTVATKRCGLKSTRTGWNTGDVILKSVIKAKPQNQIPHCEKTIHRRFNSHRIF